ncbi:putative RNA-directed DNA polymerase [Helianthus anomalus]
MPEKDVVMLIISGLREEYNILKPTLVARHPPVTLLELPGLLADHEYMTKKADPIISAVSQAFTATTSRESALQASLQLPPETVQSLQNLMTQLGFNVQPAQHQNQANYSSRGQPTRDRNNNRRGRGNYNNNRNTGSSGNNSRFAWASNQNTVYGSCNRCGIGHVPSQCPNRDPATIRPPRYAPQANFADHRSQASTSWLPDTGANSTAAPDLSSLDNAEPYFGKDTLLVGNGNRLPILHIGSTTFNSPNKTLSIKNILHVPQIKQNLLSVQRFCQDNNVFFEFHSTFFCVKDSVTRTILLTGPSKDGLYPLHLPKINPVSNVAFSTIRASPTTWHQRLGHPHLQLLQSMLSKNCLPVSNNSVLPFCNSCPVGKSSKLHLSSSNYKSTNVLDLVFCDVWGPAPVASFYGHRYFLLCVDHHTRYMWIFPIKQKSDVFAIFKQFHTMAERQFRTQLKSVQTDWGGEFRNLSSFFANLGILHRLSCPHTSEQNGFVERRHRHVVETGLTLLAQSGVPMCFWNFAFETATYLINRMPSRTSSHVSPFEHLLKRKPDLSFLRVFGCKCFPHLRPYNPHKMDFRSSPCIFLGYSPSHHGYQCLDLTSNRIYIARHVRFNETYFPFLHSSSPTPTPLSPEPYFSSYPSPPEQPFPSNTTESSTPLAQTQPVQPSSPSAQTNPAQPPSAHIHPVQQLTESVQPANPSSTEPPTVTYKRRSATDTHPTLPAYQTYQNTSPPNTSSTTPIPPPSDHTQSNSTTTITDTQPRPRPPNLRPNPKQRASYNASAFHTSIDPSSTEPSTFAIANKSPQWRAAMTEEYKALMRNGTWTLVPPVPNANVVDCKWVYRLKHDENGNIKRHKARLVAKGFNQQPGIDYHETFSPVVKSTTVRVVLSLAVTRQWPLRQLDVQNAFLHGDLKETVYLRQPQGFIDSQKPDHVCLLHKSLYGLKQAPRAWFNRLSSTLLQLGFHGSRTDPSLFIYSHNGHLLYMLVYVDDIILTGNNSRLIDHIIQQLGTTFAIQDMGRLSYFLGIEVIFQGHDLLLSQRKYIADIIQKASLSQSKSVDSPMAPNSELALGDSPLFDNPVQFRQTVGALQYLTLTRPDITFAVNKVCQFMHSPTENHWSAVKRILRYLQGTSSLGLLIQQKSAPVIHAYTDSHNHSLTAFTDADWAGSLDDRRSTGGFAIYLGSNLISWRARKQRTVSRSSTESEYKALADTVAELTWLEALLKELHVSMALSPILWCDNLGATYLSANPVFHARTKHVEIDFHFVRERVARKQLFIQFIKTDDQIADVFTKPLASKRFLFLRSKLKVAPRH